MEEESWARVVLSLWVLPSVAMLPSSETQVANVGMSGLRYVSTYFWVCDGERGGLCGLRE